MPEVTVLLCVFNGANHLQEAIDSVLQQSFEDFELLIIDDGSTDDTPGIINSVRDGRLRSIRHDTNRGLVSRLNEGLEAAAGRYVARMDADDICHRKRLECQVRFLEAYPEVGVVGTAVRVINGDRRARVVYQYPEDHEVIAWVLPFVCPLAHPSVMMRRDLIRSVGGYSADAMHAEDYDLWERLLPLTRFANLQQPLLDLRKHSASVTARNATVHQETSLAVSLRGLVRRLGRPIKEGVVACLRREHRCLGSAVPEAAAVLLELYRSASTTSGTAHAVIRRETAITLSLLALKTSQLKVCLYLFYHAFRTDPGVLGGLSHRFFGRLTGWGIQRLVG
jgi:glycosyltransferase involved in cell wall biosynthesis